MGKGGQGTDNGPIFAEDHFSCLVFGLEEGDHIVGLGQDTGVGGVVCVVDYNKPYLVVDDGIVLGADL